MYFLLTVMALLAVALLIYLAHIKIDITYKRNEQNDIIIIIISTGFGMIRYRLELPFLDFAKKLNSYSIRFRIRLKSGKEVEKKAEMKRAKSLEEFIDNMDRIADNYHKYKNAIEYLLNSMNIKDFSLALGFGVDDAYYTGILYGVLHALIAGIFAYLKGRANIEIKSIHINPVFDKYIFDLKLHCIIDFKIGHIITALAKFIKTSINTSRGSEIDGTTYSGTHENNYGKH